MHKPIYLIRTLLILCLALLTLPGWGHEAKDFTFTHIGVREGLSSQRTFSLCETTDGAVWVATKNGVDRYNGASGALYALDGPDNQMFAGRVLKFAHGEKKMEQPLAFDNGGRIYVYNKIQNRFDLLASTARLMNSSVELNDVYFTEKALWLATNKGIYRLVDGRLEPVLRGYLGNHIQMLRGVGMMLCTDRGTFVLGSNGKPVRVLGENVISSFYDVQRGRLWLGTFANGVVMVKPAKHGPWATHSMSKRIPNNPVRAITPYGSMMLIGIDGFGVYQMPAAADDESTARPLFCANDGPCGMLHGNGIYDILVDSWENIVVASYSGGLDVARPVGSTAAIFAHARNNPQSIADGHVNCVMQYSSELLVMGTEDGISLYNTRLGTWRHMGQGLVVLDVCKNSRGNILAATYGNGVCEIGMDGRVTKVFSTENGILKDDHAYKVVYDRKGNLWIGTLYGQLTAVTPQGVTYYALNNVLAMKELHDGTMAVGTIRGLFGVKLGDSSPREIRYLPYGADEANLFVQDVYESPDRRLWIATDGTGVHVHNPATGKTVQITTANGLPSNSISSITRDNSGRIWIGTEKGLAFITPGKSMKAVDVSYCYGLNTSYMRGSVANMDNGNMIYGTTDAAVIVNPRHLQRINYTATLVIKRVEMMGVEGRKAMPTDKEMFNEQIAHGLERGEIMMKYSQRSFSILFESINMRNQFDIAYQYRLGDNNWSNSFDQQYISFENLEPGTHHLYIRCVSKTSKTVIDEKELIIYIAQPWWNTWWMWIVYLLALALAFHGAWQMYELHGRYLKLIQENAKDRNTAMPLQPAANEQTVTETPGEALDETDNDEDDQSKGAGFINKATKIVIERMMDSSFTIDTLCREMSMSRTLFYMKLKTYTGKSPQEFVRVIRLERAASLLRKGMSVGEVSALTGFENPKYFSIVFKKYFQVPPSKFS